MKFAIQMHSIATHYGYKLIVRIGIELARRAKQKIKDIQDRIRTNASIRSLQSGFFHSSAHSIVRTYLSYEYSLYLLEEITEMIASTIIRQEEVQLTLNPRHTTYSPYFREANEKLLGNSPPETKLEECYAILEQLRVPLTPHEQASILRDIIQNVQGLNISLDGMYNCASKFVPCDNCSLNQAIKHSI